LAIGTAQAAKLRLSVKVASKEGCIVASIKIKIVNNKKLIICP
jgi:hypothetical protein